MTDGSFKRITDVQEEDYALHGTGFGEGLVTEKLIHPTGVVVSAAVVETEDGVLIGDPSCPVLMHGEWIDLNSQSVSLATHQYIDAFYNLEIDGISQIPAVALIVVHGVTASGLGDNELLNLMYSRQKSLKKFANNEKVSEVGGHDSTLLRLV